MAFLPDHASISPLGDRIHRDHQRPSCGLGWDTRWNVRIVDAIAVQDEGLPRGALQAIDAPQMTDLSAVGADLMPSSPVARVRHGGNVVAFPLQVLAWHRACNAELGGQPILVLYCPLSDRVEAYSRTLHGQPLHFSASGLVHRGASLFYDTETQSLWRLFDGKCIVGDYVGAQLERLPVLRGSWSEFQRQYPQAQVLSRQTGFLRDYDRSPMPDYDRGSAAATLFDAPDRRLPALDRVIAVQSPNELTVYPIAALENRRVYEDQRGADAFVVLWTPGAVSVLNYEILANARDVGTAAAFKRPAVNGHLLSLLPHPSEPQQFIDADTQSSWNIFGAAVDGPLAGKALPAAAFQTSFWFALAAARPDASPQPRLRAA